MHIEFSTSDTHEIIAEISEKLSHRKLGQIVSIDNNEQGQVIVTISKMGKSRLFFEATEGGNGSSWALSQEKVALAHRAFRNEIVEKLESFIKDMGGSISYDR